MQNEPFYKTLGRFVPVDVSAAGNDERICDQTGVLNDMRVFSVRIPMGLNEAL